MILADEATAPLDSERYSTAIIVVTHDEKIIPTFKRVYHIRLVIPRAGNATPQWSTTSPHRRFGEARYDARHSEAGTGRLG